MARLFEILPTVASVRRSDGSVQRDDRVMYAMGEGAEEALDAILKPYGELGGISYSRQRCRSNHRGHGPMLRLVRNTT